MAKRLLSGIAALSSLTIALLTMTQAGAVELGNIMLQSASGQPLVATVQLADIEGLLASDIRVRVASSDDFERFSLERIGALDNLAIEVDFSGASPVLVLSSPVAINDPFISLVLDTRWPSGRLLTEYTIRLESPAFSSQTGTSTSVAPVRSMNALLEPETEPDAVAVSPAVTAPEGSAASTADSSASTPVVVADSTRANSATVSSPSASADDPAAASDTSTVLSNASTITVNAGDTLWELALRVRPDASVSVQQTMLALQALNPDAFIGSNINRVRRGEILQVPELSEIRRITAAEAVVEVTRQNRLLASGTATVSAQPLASAPSPAPAGAGAQGELRVVTVDEQAPEPQPNAAAAGNQSTQNAQQISDLEDRVAVQEEDLARLDSQNDELNARLAMLQEQISSARELIRLRDLELARMQQTLAEESAAAQSQVEVQETVITMAPDAGPVQRFIQMVTSNTWAMLGVVATLILLLVLVLIRRNRAAAETEAKLNARDDDGMTLGDETDDLLFTGVANTSAEASAAADEQSSNIDKADESAQFAAAMASAASSAYQQVDDQTEAEQTSARVAGQEDDWQPADLTEEEPEVLLDERFELDDPGAEQQDDAPKTSRLSPALAEFDISAVDDIEHDNKQAAAATPESVVEIAVAPSTAKTATRSVDDFDDLAFLPSEDEEEFNFATDAEEAATKLDLARAYIDMEDAEGAREILEEVLKEGTEAQRIEARELLGRL